MFMNKMSCVSRVVVSTVTNKRQHWRYLFVREAVRYHERLITSVEFHSGSSTSSLQHFDVQQYANSSHDSLISCVMTICTESSTNSTTTAQQQAVGKHIHTCTAVAHLKTTYCQRRQFMCTVPACLIVICYFVLLSFERCIRMCDTMHTVEAAAAATTTVPETAA